MGKDLKTNVFSVILKSLIAEKMYNREDSMILYMQLLSKELMSHDPALAGICICDLKGCIRLLQCYLETSVRVLMHNIGIR